MLCGGTWAVVGGRGRSPFHTDSFRAAHWQWRWYFEVVGDSRCPIADTWWQTETGGIMIAPLPLEGWEQKPGSASFPFFGVQVSPNPNPNPYPNPNNPKRAPLPSPSSACRLG